MACACIALFLPEFMPQHLLQSYNQSHNVPPLVTYMMTSQQVLRQAYWLYNTLLYSTANNLNNKNMYSSDGWHDKRPSFTSLPSIGTAHFKSEFCDALVTLTLDLWGESRNDDTRWIASVNTYNDFNDTTASYRRQHYIVYNFSTVIINNRPSDRLGDAPLFMRRFAKGKETRSLNGSNICNQHNANVIHIHNSQIIFAWLVSLYV